MHLLLEEIDEVERKLIITVPTKAFEQRVEKSMVASVRAAKREGHGLSLEEVRRRHGEDIREAVVGDIVSEGFFEILEREELRPVGEPIPDVINMDPGGHLVVKVTFQVLPKIEEFDPSKIILYQPKMEITEEDIDRTIDEYRRLRCEYREVQRPVREDDRVMFIYADNVDGERIVEETRNEIRIAPDTRGKGGDPLVPAQYSQVLLGAELGEFRPVLATELDEYTAVEKGTVVEIAAVQIEEAVLPVLDAHFMAFYGIEDGDMEAFREHLRQTMTEEAMEQVKLYAKQQMSDQFVLRHPIRVPDLMVQNEIAQEKARRLQKRREAGFSDAVDEVDALDEDDETDAFDDGRLREDAEKEVLFHLVLGTIINAENMTPDEDRVREKIDEIAARSQNPERVVKHFYDDEDMLRGIEAQVLGLQAFDHVIASAKIRPVSCSYQETIWGSYTDPPKMFRARKN